MSENIKRMCLAAVASLICSGIVFAGGWKCNYCNGTGWKGQSRCSACGGDGILGN